MWQLKRNLTHLFNINWLEKGSFIYQRGENGYAAHALLIGEFISHCTWRPDGTGTPEVHIVCLILLLIIFH